MLKTKSPAAQYASTDSSDTICRGRHNDDERRCVMRRSFVRSVNAGVHSQFKTIVELRRFGRWTGVCIILRVLIYLQTFIDTVITLRLFILWFACVRCVYVYGLSSEHVLAFQTLRTQSCAVCTRA